jgi:hypothetical protein
MAAQTINARANFSPLRLIFGKNSPRRAFLSSLAGKEHLNQEANGTGLGYVRRQHFTLVLSDAPNVPLVAKKFQGSPVPRLSVQRQGI